MATTDCHDYEKLSDQIQRQKKYAWDLNTDIPWSLGVDPRKALLPLDSNAIVFPGINGEERLALSQLTGLFVNAAISEMESVIDKLRVCAWKRCLKNFPVNPEIEALGELFFEEELKHAHLFRKFNHLFCEKMGLDSNELATILPQTYGSKFLDRIVSNAKAGGHAFWWVVASVEEVSIAVFQEMVGHEADIDPLFYDIHRRHMEEEVRHSNYAFLILDLIHQGPKGIRDTFFSKTDLILAQITSNAWILSELQKIWRVKDLVQKSGHPFYQKICRTLSHFGKIPSRQLPSVLYCEAPYLSLFLNLRHHKMTLSKAHSSNTPHLPLPKPRPSATFANLPL